MQTLFLPTVILLCSFIFILIVLTVYSLWNDEKKKHQHAQLNGNKNDTPTNFNERANQILSNAQRQAHEILAEAELAGIKEIAAKKLNTAGLEKSYEKDLLDLNAEAVKDLQIATNAVEKRYEEFVTESENIIGHHISQNQARLDSHIQQAIQANEVAFGSFVKSEQQKIDQAFSKQISQVETLVNNYSKKRLELVDAHIIDLITQATKITLSKTLDFKDHTAIILEALEEAKAGGFFEKNDSSK